MEHIKDGRIHNFYLIVILIKFNWTVDRFAPRLNNYFKFVQPFQHHSRVPESQIYNYSFSLRPEEHKPSGSCNFSRINNAQHNIHYNLWFYWNAEKGLSPNNETAPNLTMMFATNYNVLRVMTGMSGLASNNLIIKKFL